jgi:hypothetical protein
MLKIVIPAIIAAIVIPLAVLLIRFNRKRLHIVRCADSATPWRATAQQEVAGRHIFLFWLPSTSKQHDDGGPIRLNRFTTRY